MASIFSFLFGRSGRFSSTKKYETKQKKEKESYLRFIEDSMSDIVSRYAELDALIHSESYKIKVNELKKEKLYSQSEEKKYLDEFTKLQKNKEIKWYLETLKQKDFKEQKEWALTFEDDFNEQQLDSSKWMTGYFWGKTLMNDFYVLAGEKQFYADSNISINHGSVCLTTKEEKVKGKAWDPAIGFKDREFDYSSALISTGQSFRQKYGKFEAKIKFRGKYPVVNAFWMLGEKMLPQIDVFKTSKLKGNELESGIHTIIDKKAATLLTTILDIAFYSQYFIYSLEWSEQALIWKINGTEVHRETKNIPDEPMYLTFCITLPDIPKSGQLPAVMEIDWVRCYKKV